LAIDYLQSLVWRKKHRPEVGMRVGRVLVDAISGHKLFQENLVSLSKASSFSVKISMPVA
jgi:hypothetical protein